MRSYRSIILMLSVSLSIMAMAQRPIRLSVTEPVAPDSADVAYYGKRDFGRAAAMITGMNVGVWAFDRYVQNADYAHITLKSIFKNIEHGFVWDNDQLGTNMFLHPYHGNLYYNSARSNGFNYWQSGLFALAGSAMWEFIFENEYPSINDIISTPVGGMALGEVMYRASDIILKDDAEGWERVGREAAGFIVAPTRGITRLLNGNMWRHRATSGRRFGIPNVAIEVSAGVRTLELRDKLFDSGTGGIVQLNLEYGDRFHVSDHPLPYDYFRLNVHLALQHGQPALSQLNLTGRLLAKEFLEDREQVFTVGMYQHFDYYDSDTISDLAPQIPYKLGVPASVGVGILYRDRQFRHVIVDTYAHANAVAMGGILSDHYNVDMRNYNLGSGFSLQAGANLVVDRDRFSLGIDYTYYRLFTWKGYSADTDLRRIDPHTFDSQGDRSVAAFGVGSVRAELRLTKHLYGTAAFSHYYRSTRYRDYPDVRSSSTALSLMLSYKL